MYLVEAIKKSGCGKAMHNNVYGYAYWDEREDRFIQYHKGQLTTLRYNQVFLDDWQPYQKPKEKKKKVFYYRDFNLIPHTPAIGFILEEISRTAPRDTPVKLTIEWEE